jgi:hypothetical protein
LTQTPTKRGKKRPSPDVPVDRGRAKEVRAEAKGSAAMTSLILQSSKSSGELLKVSIVDSQTKRMVTLFICFQVLPNRISCVATSFPQ